MARSINETEYTARRSAILDAARRLVTTRGYQQMTVQDILDELQISKGAFYHYFSSKPAVLEALIERMLDEVERVLLPIVYDPALPALEKFQQFFDASARWKRAQKRLVLALLHVWYADDNAIVRQKLRATGLKRVAPLLTPIIRQGLQEGVLTTAYPDEVSMVVVSLIEDLGDTLEPLLLEHTDHTDDAHPIERLVAVYTDAIERVLGAPAGSIHLVDQQTLLDWLEPVEHSP